MIFGMNLKEFIGASLGLGFRDFFGVKDFEIYWGFLGFLCFFSWRSSF